MLHTSYFSNVRNVKNPVAISGGVPEDYKGPRYKKLAPRLSFFTPYKEGLITEEQYTEEYHRLVLDSLDAGQVVQDIMALYPGEDTITLLCFEKPGKFCHRHLVSDWLRSEGFNIEEVPA